MVDAYLGNIGIEAVFNVMVRRAAEEGAEGTISELESVTKQAPLSEGRHITGELFTPDAVGIGPGMINPYLTLLFAMLELDSETRESTEQYAEIEQGGEPTLNDAAPFWWTRAVVESFRSLAGRESPTSLACLHDLAERKGTKNRFATLITSGLELRAELLLNRFGDPVAASTD